MQSFEVLLVFKLIVLLKSFGKWLKIGLTFKIFSIFRCQNVKIVIVIWLNHIVKKRFYKLSNPKLSEVQVLNSDKSAG